MHCEKIKITRILISSITNEIRKVSQLSLLNQNNKSYFLTLNLLCNDILKTLKGRCLISIGRAFHCSPSVSVLCCPVVSGIWPKMKVLSVLVSLEVFRATVSVIPLIFNIFRRRT